MPFTDWSYSILFEYINIFPAYNNFRSKYLFHRHCEVEYAKYHNQQKLKYTPELVFWNTSHILEYKNMDRENSHTAWFISNLLTYTREFFHSILLENSIHSICIPYILNKILSYFTCTHMERFWNTFIDFSDLLYNFDTWLYWFYMYVSYYQGIYFRYIHLLIRLSIFWLVIIIKVK